MFVIQNSCPVSQSEVELFTNAPTSTDVERGYHTHYQPVSNVEDGSIKFYVRNNQNDYVDLLHSYLLMTLKVENGNGTDLAPDAEVAPVNNIGMTLFSQIDMSLKNTLVTHSSNTSHYRSYLETLLSYGSDAKHSQLTLGGWHCDTAGHFDTLTDENAGYEKRKALVARSRHFQVLTRLHTDMSLQGRYLLNGVDIHLRLVRNANSLCLMAPADSDFKLKIVEASLYLRKVKLSDETQLSHIKKLDSGSVEALYPLSRTEVKSFTIPMGSLSCIEENLYSGALPKKLIIGMVESQAYEGRYDKNPYRFQDFGLTYCCVYRNGVQIPQKPYTPDFENGCYSREFLSLFQGTGRHFSDNGLGIAHSDYKEGNCLLVFDFTGDLSDCGAFHMIDKGSIRLELRFARALPASVNVVVLAEWDSCLRITRDRSVGLDYFK